MSRGPWRSLCGGVGLAQLLAAALVLLLAPAGAAGQRGEADLERVVEQVASAWARGEAAGVVAHAAEEGVTLELAGDATGPLSRRQAAAALRRTFGKRETLSVRSGMSRVVGRSPARAFGELTWTSRAEGTTSEETQTVFLAFVQEGGAWRLTQVRVLRR